MALSLDDLAGLTLGRQFPADVRGAVALLAATGPVQSQRARSPFVGLAARRPGTTHAEVSEAYERGEIVRGSTLRGTVHTCTAAQHPLMHAGTRVGQAALSRRLLGVDDADLASFRATLEDAAREDWLRPDELAAHLGSWLTQRRGPEHAERVLATTAGRYLAFGHGGLVRRPASPLGRWSGQEEAVYRTQGRPPGSLDDLVRLHVAHHGPVTRHDVAWWSGLGLRVVDQVVDRLDLLSAPGPDGRTHLDVPDGPVPLALSGVRLLPEFDALMCGYAPAGRHRFADPEHLARLWGARNGLVLPPLLVDGRITGFWRTPGSARRRPIEVTWFVGTRRPRASELADAAATLATALDLEITGVVTSREVA